MTTAREVSDMVAGMQQEDRAEGPMGSGTRTWASVCYHEGPTKREDCVIAPPDCLYPGSWLDGWAFTVNGWYVKPETEALAAELRAAEYKPVHLTGRNGSGIRLSAPAEVCIGDTAIDCIFVTRHKEGYTKLAENDDYRLSCGHESGHKSNWWYLASRDRGWAVATLGVSVTPPEGVKNIYEALPIKHNPLPPDSLCCVCGEDTGGKCYRCGKPICRDHTAWYGDHRYDCWECAEKYCAKCWKAGKQARTRAKGLQKKAEGARQEWLKGKD